MKIEDIQTEWAYDSKIDNNVLDVEALRIPQLHAKYYDILLNEKRAGQLLLTKQKELDHILFQLYSKTLTDDELKEYGLEMPDKLILKPDIARYVDNHKDNVRLKLRLALQQDKIDYLKSILQTVQSRSFHIKDAISWKKFVAGE